MKRFLLAGLAARFVMNLIGSRRDSGRRAPRGASSIHDSGLFNFASRRRRLEEAA